MAHRDAAPGAGHQDSDSMSSSSSIGQELAAASRFARQHRAPGADEDDFDEEDQHLGRREARNRQRFTSQAPETIRVTLDEGYFAKERRALVGLVANCRQKVNSMQMFNPAKNEQAKQQQEQWDEREKYTLDSLNEIRAPRDEKFQWSRPEDGRLVWPSKLQYFLAITSYSIGLGNVIRFPILVQKNGGLAFVIPFVVMLVVEGIPLFYLELAIGQRMRKAAISCWNLVSPFAAGIGLASAAVSFVIGLYYNTMVAWTLLYLWDSTTERPLPFTVCPRAGKQASAANASARPDECQEAGPYQYHWYRETLDASDDVDHWTNFNWSVALCLVAAWLISYLCLAKGLSNSKRVVYVSSTFPYVILTVFFVKAVNLNGMSDGFHYLFDPQAAAQVFFSLGLGFGGLIALSSYNPVNNNCYRDAIKVSLINFFTSIYAGVVIFAILGYRANIDYNKCLVEREQAIEYYLADYNLKVLDYGAVFKSVQAEREALAVNATDVQTAAPRQNLTVEELQGSQYDYYDSSDAIASIRSLDKQLDLASSKGSFDYGDSDTEFIIDASSVIDKNDLAQVINDIPDLPKCSIRQELDELTQGTGLVFVVLAQAISKFKDAQLWVTIFFLMLLTLGFDSQFGNLEGLLSSLTDLNFINFKPERHWITGVICAMSLVISVVFFSHGAGSYVFAIFDEYAASFSLIIIAIFELLAVSYIYGLRKFCDDCELMTGKRPPFIILLSWRYISPILLLVVVFATIKDFSASITYEAWVDGHLEQKVWPPWCIILGVVLILSCVIWIPAIAILKMLRISVLPEEELSRCWFPAEELREFHDIQEEHKVTKMERVLFGFTDDD